MNLITGYDTNIQDQLTKSFPRLKLGGGCRGFPLPNFFHLFSVNTLNFVLSGSPPPLKNYLN